MTVPRYDLLYADPPWRYSFSPTASRRIENHYPTMTQVDIEALGPLLPVADDAVLFLWGTAPKLPEALAVVAAWGFRYVTNATWDKGRDGMGHWFRGRHEHLLVGVRGHISPPAVEHRVSSIFREVRGRHSAKPACVRAWIERAFPEAGRLELFARPPAPPGWAVWGNEVASVPLLDGGLLDGVMFEGFL